MRKLVARGRAELVHDLGNDDEWRDLYREIAGRYTPAQFADAYITDTIAEPRALYRLDLESSDTANLADADARRREPPGGVGQPVLPPRVMPTSDPMR